MLSVNKAQNTRLYWVLKNLCYRASCVVYLNSVWCKTCSAKHWWFARAWFYAHPRCSISREHVASTQGSDWLLSKPAFLSQMAGWGDVPTGSKNSGLNQPKAHEPCTMRCTWHNKLCTIMCFASRQLWQYEQRVLQTGSSEGGLQWQRDGQQLAMCIAQHVIRVWIGPGMRDLESRVVHGFVMHSFKVLLHHVVDGPWQASHCLVLQSLNEPHSITPNIPVYFGPKQTGSKCVFNFVRVNIWAIQYSTAIVSGSCTACIVLPCELAC